MKTFTIEINGYMVGERLLEDVMFNAEVTLDNDYGLKSISVKPSSNSDESYLTSLGSVKKHCDDVLEWLEGDFYYTFLEMGDEQGVLSQEDIDELDAICRKQSRRPAVQATAISAADLFKSI